MPSILDIEISPGFQKLFIVCRNPRPPNGCNSAAPSFLTQLSLTRLEYSADKYEQINYENFSKPPAT